VRTALLKLPYVTRGEESDATGTPLFEINVARRAAADATPAAPAKAVEAEGIGAEPAIASAQDNVFYGNIIISNLGAFSLLQWDSMARLNVLVGANDTGKSHLLKMMYAIARSVQDYTARLEADRPSWAKVLAEKLVWTFEPQDAKLGHLARRAHGTTNRFGSYAVLCNEVYTFILDSNAGGNSQDFVDINPHIRPQPELRALFIPPKEVLTSMNAIAAVRERLKTFGFDDTYYDLVVALRGDPLQVPLPEPFQRVLDHLEALFEGRIDTDQGRFVFVRKDEKYGMSQTAEGIKKIGILARLIRNGSLRRNSILFLDEPETNLHPKAARALVHMLYELSRAGVQIFAATHSYFVLKEFEILARKHDEPVSLCSLERREGEVVATFADLRKGMPDTGIVLEALRQYDEDVQVSEEEG
jgi:predicted ATPase